MDEKEPTAVKMEGVKEYGEGSPVELRLRIPDRWCEKDRKWVPTGEPGRWVISAENEGGHNGTDVDLEDLLRWLYEKRPDLLVSFLGGPAGGYCPFFRVCHMHEAAMEVNVQLTQIPNP